MKKGLFISFEGSEGSGKSTQSSLLAGFLRRKGYPVKYLREPGGVMVSEAIRRLLLDRKSRIGPIAETLLYMAARAQVVEQVIRPALERGMIVLCDRFLDSTRAYQGFGLGVSRAAIEEIGACATGGLEPDLTILLDLPVKQGLWHRRSSKDRIEHRTLRYHQRVRQGYMTLARCNPGRIKVLPLAKAKETTQLHIRHLVLPLLKRYGV